MTDPVQITDIYACGVLSSGARSRPSKLLSSAANTTGPTRSKPPPCDLHDKDALSKTGVKHLGLGKTSGSSVKVGKGRRWACLMRKGAVRSPTV